MDSCKKCGGAVRFLIQKYRGGRENRIAAHVEYDDEKKCGLNPEPETKCSLCHLPAVAMVGFGAQTGNYEFLVHKDQGAADASPQGRHKAVA